ncbi:MAG: helix-turn-helix transcriptional regulator [Candidatus Neoclostridium sp.]
MKPLFSDWQWSPMSIQNVVSVKTLKQPRIIRHRGNVHSYQLGIKFSGRSAICYKGCRIDFSSSTVVFLPKEKTEQIDYTTVVTEAGNGICVFFDSRLSLPSEPQILKNIDSDIENAFLKVLYVFQRSDRYEYPDLMEAFYSLLAKLNRAIPSRARRIDDNRFSPALSHMRAHGSDEYIDLKHLAQICGMSEKYFRDAFKKTFEVSPLHYFHQQKVNNIRALISDLSLSIADVSHLSGFSDPNYFSRFFKKHFGISPTEYRNYYCKRF